MTSISTLLAQALLVAATAIFVYGLIDVMLPMLRRHALARAGARSSHTSPTPQGGGIAVVAGGLLIGTVAMVLAGSDLEVGGGRMAALALALVMLAVLGLIDDIRPLGVRLRLTVQAVAAVIAVWSLPAACRPLPWLPQWLELLILVVGLIWFVNLTNFMDGIDGITIAGFAPLAIAFIFLAMFGAVPWPAGIAALVLLGALAGFAPYNTHVARLFLGDAGSLAIGGLAGWMLILLAGRGHLASALLIALYHLADATLTLARRWRRGEALSESHRSHFYQIATDRGFTVPEVVASVWKLNLALIALALVAVSFEATWIDAVALAAGIAATAMVLARFARGPS